jgi:uncharacterized protein (TIGR02145 family)
MNPAVNFLASAKVSKTYIPTPVQIGEQIWDQKNLDTAFYSDGTPIPNVTSGWNSLTTGAWRYYGDSAANGAIYGRLYNHYAVIGTSSSGTKSLAPAGWKVAETSDWATLISYSQTTPTVMLTGVNKLRETGTAYWLSGNTGTNTSLFSARGGGIVNNTPESVQLLTYGYWRTQDSNDIKRIAYNSNNISAPVSFSLTLGCSVRLIKIQTPVTGLTTNTVSGQTLTSITTGGTFNLSTFPYSSITDKGIVYGTSPNPTYTSNNIIPASDPTVISNFSITISSLPSNTGYFIRSYVVSGGVRYYGTEVSGSTGTGTMTLSTTDVYAIEYTTAISGGDITNDGGSAVIARGVCWSSSTSSPTIANSKTTNGTGTGSFTSSMTGLTQNTHYYVRAYATNSITTSYGAVKQFDTIDATITLTTTSVGSNFTFTTAISGGTITDVPDTEVTQKGICWSTSSNPTTSNSKTTEGASYILNEPFSSTATGMYPGTPYFIRSYATNAYTTSYGDEATVTTATPNISITTDTISNLNAISVSCGATAISNPDVYTISQVGFCWGLTSDVTKGASNFVSNGALVTAPFTLNTGNVLAPQTGYFIRAYAIINSLSNYIVYGSSTPLFTTLSATPTVTTNAVTAFNAQSITAGGSVTLTNGIPVLDKGLCWDLYPNVPVKVAGKFVSAGAGEGTFSGALITGLTFGQHYNILAYSTNGYGAGLYYASNTIDQTTYTPNIVIETVTDTNPFPLSMTCGGNGIVDDAAYPITEKGYCYSSSVNPPTIANTKVLASPQTGTVSFTANTGNMLTPNVSYYVRAYALNSTTGFVDYGSTVTVLTPNDNATATIPVINNVTQYTADVAYSIGAGTYYTTGTRGICYTIAPIVPTIANGTVVSVSSPPGALAGSFTITLDPLVPFTQYNFKSFITNSAGTVYSQMSTATTLFAPVIKNAYSLRKVVPGYTGSAIRCRNAAGSLANIPFNADGSLNTVALLAHTGVSASSQGTVETWYDQSGTNNMTIAVVFRPCYIVLNGVLQIKNNKPAIFWNAATIAYFRTLTTGSWQVNNLSIFMVSSTTSTAEAQYGLQLGNMIFPRPNTTTDFIKYSASNIAITLGTSSTAIKLDSTLTTSTNISAWRNNGSVVTFTGTDTTTATVLYFGANLGTGNNKFSGTIQELIIYAGNVDGDLNTFTTRNTISSEIMGYYNIT